VRAQGEEAVAGLGQDRDELEERPVRQLDLDCGSAFGVLVRKLLDGLVQP
jgi:hypothetical protein